MITHIETDSIEVAAEAVSDRDFQAISRVKKRGVSVDFQSLCGHQLSVSAEIWVDDRGREVQLQPVVKDVSTTDSSTNSR